MTVFLLRWVLTASVLIAAVLLLRGVFGRRISARLRYALWAVVLVRLLVPVQLLRSPVETPQVFPEYPAVFQAGPALSQPAAERNAFIRNPENAGPVQVIPAPGESTADVPAVQKPLDPLALLGGIWLAGAAVMALALLWSNLRFVRRLRRVRVPLEGTDCFLRVYTMAGLPSPCLFGTFFPAVYVTPETAADPVCLRHVLAHETTHFRHGDQIWSLLRCVALAVHWWNPLVWLAAVLSRRDAELACDEGALKRLGDGERRAYGNTLLTLVTAKPRPGDLLCCATTMAGGKRSLRERVSRIARAPRRWLWAAVLSAVLAVLVCACSFAKTGEAGRPDGPLSEEELEQFNTEIFNGEGFNLRNQFLFLAVEAPKDYKQIDLFQLFYNGTGQPVEVTEEERQAVAEAACGGEDPGVDLVKCPAAQMNEILQRYLGLTLEETDQWGLDQFTYLEEYDAYYTFHGDTNYPGEITFTSGERKDGKVLLYYEGSGFPVLSSGDGSFIPWDGFMQVCAVLEEQTDGGFRFLSNWQCDPPAHPTVYPSWEPELVIPLDGLEPYQPPEVQMERREGDRAESLYRTRFEPDEFSGDGFDLEIYRSADGSLRASVVVSETERDCFLTVSEENSVGWTPEGSVEPFTDLFGQTGLRISYYGQLTGRAFGEIHDYYIFSDGGTPSLLLRALGNVTEADLDGSGEREVTASDGWNVSRLFFQRNGTLYEAELYTLIHDAWPEAGYLESGFWDPDVRCLHMSIEVPLDGTDITVSAYRTLWFDGENLRLYKDGSVYKDHVKEGIDAPADVVAAAQDFAQERFDALAEEGYGTDGSGDYNEENFGPGNVVWDDWRVTGLSGPYYETVGNFRVEVWNVSYETHTATPERVILAGGSYLGEDGWGMIGYPGCDYLFFLLNENEERTYLFSSMENDCAPGTELFQEDLLYELEIRGLLSPGQAGSPEELTQEELQAFHYYFNGGENAKLHNGLLRVHYNNFQEAVAYLGILFYDLGEPISDEAEREAAAELCGGLEWAHTKFTTQRLRECFAANFYNPDGLDWLNLGVDLTEVLGSYSAEYDAYYMRHSDNLMSSVLFDYGERNADGTVNLYYSTNLWYYTDVKEPARSIPEKESMCATLAPDPDVPGNWLMIANVRVDETAA